MGNKIEKPQKESLSMRTYKSAEKVREAHTISMFYMHGKKLDLVEDQNTICKNDQLREIARYAI